MEKRPMRRRRKALKIEDFTFIGYGSSEPSEDDPISENHDEVYAKILYEEMMEKRAEYERNRSHSKKR